MRGLLALSRGIDRINLFVGQAVSWLVLLASRLAPEQAYAAARGWGGDAYVAYRRDGETTVHLAAMVHARSIFLTDVATLGEAHPVQLTRVAFEPERLARS